MAGGQPGAAMVPLERVELVSQDMDLIADVIRQLYVEHAATFGCADPDLPRSSAWMRMTSRLLPEKQGAVG